MWPWGHAAVGYVAYAGLLWVARRWPPSRLELVVVLFATQIPDLIDKTFAWVFAVLPSGRSLGHSLLTWVVVVGATAFLLQAVDSDGAGRRKGVLLTGVVVGYLTAIVTDLPMGVLSGDFSRATFLLWPLLSAPNYSTEPSVVGHVYAIRFSLRFWIQVLGFLLVGWHVLWVLRPPNS